LDESVIAEKLKIPSSTVKSKLQVAIGNLMKKFQKQLEIMEKKKAIDLIKLEVLDCLNNETPKHSVYRSKLIQTFPGKN